MKLFCNRIISHYSHSRLRAQYDASKINPQAVKLFEASNELAYNDANLQEGLESLKKAVLNR